VDNGEERIGDAAIQAQIRFQARKVMIQATVLTLAMTTGVLLLPG
jgi:hypothetical protein